MGWREDYEVNGPGVDPHDYQYEDTPYEDQ